MLKPFQIPNPEFSLTVQIKFCISLIMDVRSANFMDFLKFAAKRRFQIDSDNVSFTKSDKTKSTIRQYNSAFHNLTSFITRKMSEMSVIQHCYSLDLFMNLVWLRAHSPLLSQLRLKSLLTVFGLD